MKILVFVIIIIAMAAPVCMAEERSEEKGLFSQGSFLSEAINSAADKLSSVTSGEDKIVNDDAKGIDKDILEYDGDPLNRHRTGVDKELSRRKLERQGRAQDQGL